MQEFLDVTCLGHWINMPCAFYISIKICNLFHFVGMFIGLPYMLHKHALYTTYNYIQGMFFPLYHSFFSPKNIAICKMVLFAFGIMSKSANYCHCCNYALQYPFNFFFKFAIISSHGNYSIIPPR